MRIRVRLALLVDHVDRGYPLVLLVHRHKFGMLLVQLLVLVVVRVVHRGQVLHRDLKTNFVKY